MFRVEYLQSALDDLAAAWLNADSTTRSMITAATNRIDIGLLRNPQNVGESRPGGRRILFELPLAAVYRIDSDGNTVIVVEMWLVPKRSTT